MMKKLVSLHPDVAEAWMLQAAIAQRLRNASELIGALDKVLMIDENNVRAALLKLGVLQAGTQTELQTFAGQFSKANPGAKSFKIAYGRELLKREQSELALEQFLSILSTAPKDAQALNLTALVYHSLGDFKHSASYFERHLEVSPDDDQSRVYLASALHQLGRLDEASEMVKTIEDDADRFNSYRQIAMHIEETQGADEGIAYLQAIETQNQDQQIQLIRDEGYMLTRDERPQEELALLDEQLFTFPESVLLRYQRALLYVELKNIEAHEKEMRILLELDSENAHYVNTLGYSLLLEDDRLDDAEVLINKAHALKPDDPFILDSKGWLEFKLGNAKAAILHLNQAFEIDPDPEIAAHLGEVHWSLGDQEKARKIWLDAIENHAENKSLNEVIERFIK
jgi:tetratricopeptide (TPR) repeat protein